MKYSLAYLVLTVASLIVINPTAALALDYYVDGPNGHDANSGLSPDDAFKTITHALQVIQPSEDTPGSIFIAAGTYAASTNGETFPLVLKAHLRLLGQGPEASILDAEYNAHHILICQSVENVGIIGLSLLHSYPLGEDFSEDGGCPIICDSSSLELDGCVVAESSGTFAGDAGAILCTDSKVTLHSCIIRDNRAGVRWGGGGPISASGITCAGSSLTVRSCVIEKNMALPLDMGGGVIYRGAALSIVRSELALDNSRVCANTGGGVSLSKSAFVMRNCTLEENTGGATVYCEVVPEAWIVDCVIRGNTAASDVRPGDTCVSFCLSTMHLVRCVIAENSALRGAIGYKFGDSPPPRLYIEDSLICDNLSFYGGPIICTNSQGPLPIIATNGLHAGPGYGDILSVKRCTIVGNRAWEGRADYLYVIVNGSDVEFEDNIVAGNDGRLFCRSDETQLVRNCCLQEEFEGEGNFVADPLFVSGPLGDYYLSSREAGQDADSRCIDAGSTSASIAGVGKLTTRTDGAFDNGWLDIGYHYSAPPPTIQASVANLTNPSVPAIPHFAPGEILSASVTVENGGLPVWVDIYAGFILPDGTLFCVGPGGLTTGLVPWAATSLLPTDFVSGDVVVFEAQLPEGLPQGAYTFAAALSRAREPFRPIGDIAFYQLAVGS